jgi:hypothetical protein
MRLSRILIITLCLFQEVKGQYKIPKLENISAGKGYAEDSLVSTLKKTSKVIITFRTHSAWSFYSKYCILTLGKDDSLRYHLLFTNPEMKGLYRVYKTAKSLDSIWNNCVENNLFALKTETKTHNNCNSIIFDSGYYEFVILIGSKRKIVEYYAPRYFEKECPGDKDRNLLINCANPFLNNNSLL